MDFLRAILVQSREPGENDLLEEFQALAETAGYTIVEAIDIVGRKSARFAMSSGKVEEVATHIELNKPDVVLFSPGLKSSQLYRLMDKWSIEVRDRNQLILEIFSRHARTPQAKLQIEQARLEYELPFLRHQLRVQLQSEHTGARPVGEQVGAGEDLLNLRTMELRRRIANIRSKLEKISDIQELKRKRRSKIGFLEVTLTGYTNAGKSTLHRALTGSEAEVADQLFTTLSTKTRRIDIPGRQVVVSDSVGFISDLPTELLEAFNTTLMEIGNADVIVLVVDATDSVDEMDRKVRACISTFQEIGVNGIPVVVALNKTDLIEDISVRERMTLLQGVGQTVVPISAREETNIEELVQEVRRSFPALYRYHITIPYESSGMSMVSWLHENGYVESEDFGEDSIFVDARLSFNTAQRLFKMLPKGSVERLDEIAPTE
ncbi:GTPase HflX [Candidatus Thorarchaeota archaeon]|nr:MAG: GTPase HflX [Candidatus Thorarchaeota archaeon]